MLTRIKSKQEIPVTIMKLAITNIVNEIPVNMCENVSHSVHTRMEGCVEVNDF